MAPYKNWLAPADKCIHLQPIKLFRQREQSTAR